ncbi:hypothetical protein O9H85_14355 [Paenibacillus filicis]|uniref:Peptidase G2 IMC autoproteolytic cleavage domain-containing protein n=1 Tax=Paenibacillus gyeongsangnamensis TaxID=3388067 RepID=A0ABT4QA95_9BACL|nr:peptidase G2 autoproteolytic cleavage domain-containing protein [Paenibacillus filicis]MCZ8513595.1 hypothetical protein [Paenibacillus filicis]
MSNNLIGHAAHVEGYINTAIGDASHAEGGGTVAGGLYSHSEGMDTKSMGTASHAEGGGTRANGLYSHSEGQDTRAVSHASHAEGYNTETRGNTSHAEGDSTTAEGNASHAEGGFTSARGDYSHGEGFESAAGGFASHAEGEGTAAAGAFSHAEGSLTTAGGDASHAEGEGTQAGGIAAHAEGLATTARGLAAHSEGIHSTASGVGAHAEGFRTAAGGFASHSGGKGTSTAGLSGAYIAGKYGDATDAYSWHLANGTDEAHRGLAAKISTAGDAFIGRTWFAGGSNYAEMFETTNGNPIDCGYFVTFDGAEGKIRIAKDKDKYILGITCARPSIAGNSEELHWSFKYVTDEWGRVQYQEATVPAVFDSRGKLLEPEHTEFQPVLNPVWDSNQRYKPRRLRTEWVMVGLLGQMHVRDNGDCTPGEYCRPNGSGIAVPAKEGYRVMKRTGPHQIMVLFR